MTYTLSLDVMSQAARFDGRCSDLIIGAPNYGLRPERRIKNDQQLFRKFGLSINEDSEELWLSPPKGYDSWTAVLREEIKSDPTWRLTE